MVANAAKTTILVNSEPKYLYINQVTAAATPAGSTSTIVEAIFLMADYPARFRLLIGLNALFGMANILRSVAENAAIPFYRP